MTKIAFVGTGFVADYYMTTLQNHPGLQLAGVWDLDAARLSQFCDFHGARAYADMQSLLDDGDVRIVVNLTNPESHYAVNRACLEAGKHVYCEKPLAMNVDEAEALAKLAAERGLTVCCAPANALSTAHEAFVRLMAKGEIGRPRLVYAEMEDGPVFRADWQNWRSRSGARWPGAEEFKIGCTLEHAGYALSWLVDLFGPVVHLSASSALCFPDKGVGCDEVLAPDFSVGLLTFESGVRARLTCGLAAPRDRSLTVLGDRGSLILRDLWDDNSPIHLSAPGRERSFLERALNAIEHRIGRTLPVSVFPGKRVSSHRAGRKKTLPSYPSQIDFMRGIAEQASALEDGTTPFFSGDVALHLTELVLALNAGEHDYTPKTRFDFSPRWGEG
ncbi:Predicted dehydrogenase [Nitratireductor aquibiodomus]|uniref:Predicted dehydrogenase n=1 Tax=Nitratireductor aquibiodomus TaxID=204799 RepID=A0A1H4JPK0_9HYPH|nr:Gfo/Idh/MocA family oxidoreductase [Nitratireductor aquibiodomus]SEB48183.1 Predicted dehydrogenase [Nitratireductor aquibiodomus]